MVAVNASKAFNEALKVKRVAAACHHKALKEAVLVTGK